MKKRGTYTEVEVYVLFVCLKLGKNFLVNEKNYLPKVRTRAKKNVASNCVRCRMRRDTFILGSIPAVHPRYQHVYRGLYGEHSSEENGGSSFFARMFISFLIFGMFVAADYTGEKIWKYTPSQIVSQIEYQPDIMTGNW